MNSALREMVQGFLKSRSVSHSVELRVKKGETPASSSSQFSIGVVSTAKFGANVAAPPITFQLVAAPISRIARGSLSSGRPCRWPQECVGGACPYTDNANDRKAHAIASVNARVCIEKLVAT